MSAKRLSPNELMAACRESGKGGNWEPEAIEQWLWMLANGEGPERALAWVKMQSIPNGSASCVNKSGRALTIDDMAKDLALAFNTARKFCYELASEGRIRTHKGRIWYRADVPEKASRSDLNEADQKDPVQGLFPTYLVDFIRSLSSEKRERVTQYVAWRKQLEADALAGARVIGDLVEDTMFRELGCKKKHLPKRRPTQTQFINLSLIAAPDFVQGQLDFEAPLFVQNGKNGSYKPENGSVHGDVSLLSSDTDSDYRGAVSRSVADRQTDLHTSELIHELLLGEWGEKFPGEVVTPKLVRQIRAALKGASLDLFRSRLRQRGSAATGMGFALTLARDVGQRFEQTERVFRSREIERERKEAQAWLDADPRDWEDARETYDTKLAQARATLARLDSELVAHFQPKAKGHHS